jgi:hypothetical protein
MSWKTYFLVTGIIFALVALAHAAADLYGLASPDRGLVSAEVS